MFKLWKNGEDTLGYLDGLSNGLISCAKPKDIKYSGKENEFTGENFRLYYATRERDSCAVVLDCIYESPIGRISLHVGAIDCPKDFLEREFLKKDVLDGFLLKMDGTNDGLLKEMIRDKAEHGGSSDKAPPVMFFLTLQHRQQPWYRFEINSNKGRFRYDELGLEGKGVIYGFSEKFSIGGASITVDSSVTARVAYGKISRDEAGIIVGKQLKENIDRSVLRHLPGMSIREAEIEDGFKRFVAEDDAGRLHYEKGFDKKETFHYDVSGDHRDKKDYLKLYDCSMWVENGMTRLYGNPLLITRLGRELSGKYDYGLLTAKDCRKIQAI